MADGRRLIVYATPGAELGSWCADLFAEISRRPGPTTAQAFPPHVSLTGFFTRADRRAEGVIGELSDLLAVAMGAPERTVIVEDLVVTADWIGLPIRSHWLDRVVADCISLSDFRPGEDALRPKTRLHLSLAYGQRPPGVELDAYRSVVSGSLDGRQPNRLTATWELAVWEQLDHGRWHRHPLPSGAQS